MFIGTKKTDDDFNQTVLFVNLAVTDSQDEKSQDQNSQVQNRLKNAVSLKLEQEELPQACRVLCSRISELSGDDRFFCRVVGSTEELMVKEVAPLKMLRHD
jgi:hypothetical protein